MIMISYLADANIPEWDRWDRWTTCETVKYMVSHLA